MACYKIFETKTVFCYVDMFMISDYETGVTFPCNEVRNLYNPKKKIGVSYFIFYLDFNQDIIILMKSSGCLFTLLFNTLIDDLIRKKKFFTGIKTSIVIF